MQAATAAHCVALFVDLTPLSTQFVVVLPPQTAVMVWEVAATSASATEYVLVSATQFSTEASKVSSICTLADADVVATSAAPEGGAVVLPGGCVVVVGGSVAGSVVVVGGSVAP